MPAPEIVHQLVNTFTTHRDHYKSGGYNETELRREFLDPLFKSLGWDIDNEQGYADAYKDIIHEDAIKIGGYTKAPDYCFRIGGQRKFFLEAKRPSIDIKADISPAYQLRRYAWSAKLPLSILSDFEELAVYDCRIRPKSGDKASTARTLYFSFEEYIDRWDELAAIFSREAVLKGSFDKYAETAKKKRGTAEVDDAFLKEIERWRDLLARNFLLRNPTLSVRDLNFAVQKTIDRLIFLRICEDRGTEDYGRLAKLRNGTNIYRRMLVEFRRADDRYNSGIFHFRAETERAGAPDALTPSLSLDDKVVKDIVKHLYYPDSPYEFSVLPADILGQVYEQFLGKTIRLGSGAKRKTVTIEEKPEVRKAGGVYYTPSYIVDYIVENTLGRLLNGDDPENPKPISISLAEKIKVVDPACGSGSFIIVAFQYLLDWHRDQYTLNQKTNEEDTGKIKRHSSGKSPKIYQAKGGEWKLTTAERKRILLNNIHGVDIDSQAVEVTKLSLLLKVLEGETQQNLQRDFLKENQRILPDLGHNIRCGNSLIGPDFYDQPELLEIDEDTRFQINVFDWEACFPDIFEQGGFDCVIGNPPWGASLNEAEKAYLRVKYSGIIVRMIDSFMYFISASFNVLSEGGAFGMITPDVILYQKDNSRLRHFLFSENHLRAAINAGNVFENITRPTAIVISKKITPVKESLTLLADLSKIPRNEKKSKFVGGLIYENTTSTIFSELPDFRIPTSNISIYSTVSKLVGKYPPLADFLDADGIQRGVSPDLKEAFIFDSRTIKDCSFERDLLRSTVTGGKQIQRYWKKNESLWLFYSGRNTNYSDYPNLRRHIDSLKDKITCKEVISGKHSIYSLHRSRKESIFTKAQKLVGVVTQDRITLHCDCDQLFPTDGLYLFGVNEKISLKYIMGILNSQIMVFLYRSIAFEGGRTLAQVKPTLLSILPIRPIDYTDSSDVDKHNRMVSHVDRIIELHRERANEKNPETLRHLEIQITATDRQIDRLVYKLYDLTADEIKLIEQ